MKNHEKAGTSFDGTTLRYSGDNTGINYFWPQPEPDYFSQPGHFNFDTNIYYPAVNTDDLDSMITMNKNRLKNKNGNIYLKDGSNFEIELYNGSTSRMLVHVKLNGQYISESGLVINPGQRYFLDRYVTEARKFQFKTYDVKDTKKNRGAIELNGLVEVEFYSEIKPIYQPFIQTYNNAGIMCVNSMETGRVEMGEKSNQKFDTTHGNFDAFASKTIKFKLLPESREPIQANEIKHYCSNCGYRIRKQTWKFCPQCGSEH